MKNPAAQAAFKKSPGHACRKISGRTEDKRIRLFFQDEAASDTTERTCHV